MEQICTSYLGDCTMKLNPEWPLEQCVIETGFWEEHVVKLLQYFIKPGFACVDVGANSGFHTIAMAKYSGERGQVYAFEPNSLTNPRLLSNLELNPALKSRVVVEKLGLSNRHKTLKLYQAAKADGNAYISEEYNPNLWNAGGPDDFQTCEVLPLDDYLKGRRVDLLKIDVEGMEYQVMLGARQTIARHHPIIIYETLLDCFEHQGIIDTEKFLLANGYYLFGLLPIEGKLVAAGYPHYSVDTIAVHKSKLHTIFPIFQNVASFAMRSLDLEDSSTMELLILGYDTETYLALFTKVQGLSETTIPVVLADNKLSFSCTINGAYTYFDIDAPNDTLTTHFGKIVTDSGSARIEIKRIEGDLKLYPNSPNAEQSTEG